MNLVAKEFVAARDDEQGVLVLSQFTGAARELTEALIVNPYDLDQASDALALALRMPPDEQRERMRSMRRLVSEFNVYRWAGRMLVDAAELRRKERHHGPAVVAAHAARRPRRIMKALLSRENRVLLDQLAWSNVLLAFDFDGTLAPIVANRHQAAMRARTARLFSTVCERYPSAVISGRAKADVARRLDGAKVRYLIGNHGLEPGTRLGTFERQVVQAHPLLDTALDGVAGIDIENKRYSLAVHYRRAREKPKAREAIRRAVAALPVPMRIIPGKLVINVVPEAAPSKGDALIALRDRTEADVAMYVGDDVTDEDVFRLDQPGRLFTVRIGRSRTSAARYYLRQQQEIDALLEHLVALRVDAAAGAERRGGARS